MTTLAYEDDAASHERTASPVFRESYYCNFADPHSDLHGVAWQGVRPNAGAGEAVFVLFDGDTPLIHSLQMHEPVAADIGDERTAIGNQRFECVEPWSHWRVHYGDERATATVDWRQLSRTCDWEWDKLMEGNPDFAAKHYQAAGRVTVDAVVDGRHISFEGFGERDRAWGPRNYDPIDFGWWMTIQFADAVCAHAFVQLFEGEYRLAGFLHKDGETRDLVSFEATDVVYDGEGGPAAGGRQLLTDDLGRTLDLVSTDLVNQLSFGTVTDGVQLRAADPGAQARGRLYLTFQQMTRADGMVGRGMIDNNLCLGIAPTAFTAGNQPLYSRLYDYGLAGVGAPHS
ncbi:MAG: hypothetical protein QOF76_64 [Solirubrobacteraceae bacterium]|jgi:hypothetical protein|nr:hypothetical protein [Solirubrobacteraceae bacterium]